MLVTALKRTAYFFLVAVMCLAGAGLALVLFDRSLPPTRAWAQASVDLILFPYDGFHNIGLPPETFSRDQIQGFMGPRTFSNSDNSWRQLGFVDSIDFLNPPPKPENELRVIVIGGSGAQGQEAPVPERFDRKLEALLNEKLSGTKWHTRFINMAMGGSITYQNYITINRWGRPLEPDIILSYSGRNDLWVPFIQGTDGFYLFPQLSYLTTLMDYSVDESEPAFMKLFAKYLPRIYGYTPFPFHIKDLFFGPEYRRIAINRYRRQFGHVPMGEAGGNRKSIDGIAVPLQAHALKSIKRDLLGIPIVVAWQYTNKTDISGNDLTEEIYDHMFDQVRDQSLGHCNDDWLFTNTHAMLRQMADPALGSAHLTPKGHTVVAGLLLEPMYEVLQKVIKRRSTEGAEIASSCANSSIASSSDRGRAKAAGTPPPPTGPFANWRHVGLTVQGDAEYAPDGTKTATKLIEDTSNGSRGISAVINVDLAKPISASLSAHPGEGRRLLLFLATGPNQIRCDVDLETGRVTPVATGVAKVTNCAATRQQQGWWRVEITGSIERARGADETLFGIAPTPEPFKTTYQGDGAGSIVIWNAAVAQ